VNWKSRSQPDDEGVTRQQTEGLLFHKLDGTGGKMESSRRREETGESLDREEALS